MIFGNYIINDWRFRHPYMCTRDILDKESEDYSRFSKKPLHFIQVFCTENCMGDRQYQIYFSLGNPFCEIFKQFYPNIILYRNLHVNSFEEGMSIIDAFLDKLCRLKVFL